MKCSICYIEFINPKEYSKEAFDALFKGETTTHNNFDPDKFMRFTSLIIQKDNNPFKCNTPNCEHLYCVQCYTKIKQGENVEDEWDYGKKDTFQCAYCRNIDYKDYMKNNVLNDMMLKVLGTKNFAKWYVNTKNNMFKG
jgi:hypothetical protein